MAENYVPPQPQIGTPVQWFAHADGKETPSAAQIVSISNLTAVNLLIKPPRGGFVPKHGVRYLFDPFLKTCEQDFRNAHGAWDFIPGLVACEPPEVTALHRKIRQLHAEGQRPAKIATELGGNWTQSTVAEYLQRQGLVK
jgi:hypothetical protein